MAANDFTPYSTGESLFGQKITHVSDALNQARLQSYLLYDKIYWNVPTVFALSLRGSDALPIYVPAGRTIVDTVNRYVAPGFGVNVHDRENPSADTPDVLAARMILGDLFARERFSSRFAGGKRYNLVQGDWIWHITADPTKLVGSRISMTILSPSLYFPVFDDDDVDKLIAVMLAQPVTVGDSDQRVKRLTYRRDSVTGAVSMEVGMYTTDAWENIDATPESVVTPLTVLPPSITQIPVYHTKNFEEPGNPFGSSELRGFERLMSGLTQTLSDEELALALDGIGMYATTAGKPVDPVSKAPIAWQLGPGRVVHHPAETTWERVNGVGTLSPFGEHWGRLWDSIKWGAGTPDVAIGTVDVAIAQSGIALALQLSPIIYKAREKNQLLVDSHTQMFYDVLTMWYPAYEATTFDNVTVDCVTGDAVPVDRTARFTELNDMLDRGVIDRDFYRTEAAKLGYVFPEGIAATASAEFDSSSGTDPVGDRIATEAAA